MYWNHLSYKDTLDYAFTNPCPDQFYATEANHG